MISWWVIDPESLDVETLSNLTEVSNEYTMQKERPLALSLTCVERLIFCIFKF